MNRSRKKAKVEPEKKDLSPKHARRSSSSSLERPRPSNASYDAGAVESLRQDDFKANPKVRFEATIHAGRRTSAGIQHLDIDRVPSPPGQVRALVTADECVQLLAEGFEVRLHHAHPVGPLDPALITSDESVSRTLDELLLSITLTGEKKSKRGKRT
jgi:hypothetical protein